MSGPIGGVFLPMVQATQVWVKYTNAKGGVNGHEVRLLVYDDGGDPSRHKAQVQEAIEGKKAIALIANAEGIAGRSSVEYVTSKGVPVIGSEGGADFYYESPMYFPQHTTYPFMQRGVLPVAASLLKPKGKTKIGILVCAEATQCDGAGKLWASDAKSFGFEVVYQAKASVAQPDFTAECLGAANSGVQIFFLLLDGNSIERVATACGRQSFRPVFATTSTITDERMAQNPLLDGMLANSPVFPYFQTGTPATDEYHTVMANYGKGVKVGVAATGGWVAAKLLERAAADLPEPPTSAAILKGLWSLKNDDLGGLTHPLNFVEGRNAPHTDCWWSMVITNKAWSSPDNYRRYCRDDG